MQLLITSIHCNISELYVGLLRVLLKTIKLPKSITTICIHSLFNKTYKRTKINLNITNNMLFEGSMIDVAWFVPKGLKLKKNIRKKER